ncbi:MAG: hypothetical protein FD174_2866 [Geobacteraceae bacterium]|nr:MAG: hypothetical protein FD174_2866 [Geobacteraceae bacterium]
MKLPALQGKTRPQVQLGYVARAKCLKAWEADSARSQLTDVEYELLITNTDATWFIANQKRTLAEVLERMQRIPALAQGEEKKPALQDSFMKVGPLRDRQTGEIVPESDEAPF